MRRLLAATVLLAVPTLLEAYVLTGGKWAPADIPVVWQFNSQDEPDLPADGERVETRAGFQVWEDLSSSTISFSESAPVSITACGAMGMFQQDGDNVVTFADPCNQLDSLTLGLTALFGRAESLDNSCAPFVRITESDIVFSEEHAFVSHADAGLPSCSGAWDIRVVATHEIGHFLGLDHSADTGAIMYFSLPRCDPSKASLHADDEAGAACIYPGGGPSCFAQSVSAVSDPSLCAGAAVSLIGTGSSVIGCNGSLEYRWTGTNGFLRDWSVQPNASDTPLLTTDYTLEIRCTNPGCSDSAAPRRVAVSDNPAADAGPALRVCQGGTVTLGATPPASGGTPPYVLAWSASPPDPTLSCSSCANPSATPQVATRYTLTVTDAAGCQATANATVDLDPLPVLEAGPDRGLCAGESTTLGGAPTVSGGAPPYTILWTAAPLDPSLACPACDNPSVSPAATTRYQLDVSDARGCSQTAAITVTVDTPLPPSLLGNSLQLVRGILLVPPAPDDLALTWSGVGGSAVTYRVRRAASKAFPLPGDDLGTGDAGPALVLPGELTTSGSPLHYRVAGVNCAGEEGPL